MDSKLWLKTLISSWRSPCPYSSLDLYRSIKTSKLGCSKALKNFWTRSARLTCATQVNRWLISPYLFNGEKSGTFGMLNFSEKKMISVFSLTSRSETLIQTLYRFTMSKAAKESDEKGLQQHDKVLSQLLTFSQTLQKSTIFFI